MIQELVYTSAPKGLKPGSGGFCTVASTPGMAINLARFLTVQSRYRHLIPPGSAGAESNPVNYSNVKSKIGGRDFHVVSRVADAGLDYSNRSNMIAHHFAIDDARVLACGPAAILKKEEQFYCEWKKDPTKLDPRKPSGILSQAKPCDQWKSVTGDAGWAGDVFEAFKKKVLVYIIIEPSVPALDLVNELLSLLPVEQQWDFTFSTFYTKGPSNVDCGIRFIMAGSPEVAVARRNQANLVLDLTKPLGQSQSKFADNARNGKMLYENKPSVVSPKLDDNNATDQVEKPSDDLRLAEEDSDLEIDDDPPELPSTQLQHKTHLAPPTLKGGYKPNLPKSEIVVTQRDSKLGVVVFAASLLFLLIGLTAAFPFVFRSAEVAEGGSEKKAVTEKREDAGPDEKGKPKTDAENPETQTESENDKSNSGPDDTSHSDPPTENDITVNEEGESQSGDSDPPAPPGTESGTGQNDGNTDANMPSTTTMEDQKSGTKFVFTESQRTQRLLHIAEGQAIGDVRITSDIDFDAIFANLKLKLSGEAFEITMERSDEKISQPQQQPSAEEAYGQKFAITSKDIPDSPIGYLAFSQQEKGSKFDVKYENNSLFFGQHESLYEKLNSSVLTMSLYGKEKGVVDLSALEPRVEPVELPEKKLKAFESRTLWEDAESEVKFRSTDSNDQKHAIYVGDGSSGKYRLTFEINYEIRNNSGLRSVLEYELKSIKFGDVEFGLGKKGKKNTGSPIPNGVVNNFLNQQIVKSRTSLNEKIKNIDPKQQGHVKLKTRLKGELSDLDNFKSQLEKGIMFFGEEDVLELVSEEENIIYKINVKYDLEKFSLLGQSQGPKKGQGLQKNDVDPHGIPDKKY
ncbi:hypothetical protein N9B05_02615 [Mariniblastus sp.]|nr:hypothetical protein [Mariniblastus sp.]